MAIHGTGNTDRSARVNRTARTRRSDATRSNTARARTRSFSAARAIKYGESF